MALWRYINFVLLLLLLLQQMLFKAATCKMLIIISSLLHRLRRLSEVAVLHRRYAGVFTSIVIVFALH